MDGMAVFAFGLKRAPESVLRILEYSKVDKEDIDLFIFHQANLFMNEKIRKKLSIPVEKVPYCLRDFGNTSCTTIPLLLASKCPGLLSEKKKVIATAFGVGLSWGSALLNLDKMKSLELIVY